MGNAVVHFEIGGRDDAPLVAFYGELFGWKLQPFEGGGYTLIDTNGGGGINGGIGKSQTGEPWSTFYVEAEDLQAVLDKAESLGAKTAMRFLQVEHQLMLLIDLQIASSLPIAE